jgi:hypothetical protein
MADDASQQHEQKRERQAGEADANSLGSGRSAMRHVDEAMVGFDDMQASTAVRPLTNCL